jgi:hypothetical protein
MATVAFTTKRERDVLKLVRDAGRLRQRVAEGQRWQRSEEPEGPEGSEAARGRGDKGGCGSGGG